MVTCQEFRSWHYPPSYAAYPKRSRIWWDIGDENRGKPLGRFENFTMVPTLLQTWGNPCIGRGIASIDGANVSQGFGRHRIPPLSSIAQVVVVVGPDVLGVVKHNGVQGGKHEKHRESESGMEGRAGRRWDWCTRLYGMVPTSLNQVSHMDE